MARGTNKKMAKSIINALNADIAFTMNKETNTPNPNLILNVNGRFNIASALTYIKKNKLAKNKSGVPTNNVMVLSVDVIETNKKMSARKFYDNSDLCVSGTSYGHDTVTREFKITYATVMYIDENGFHTTEIQYFGITTDNKLLNYAKSEVNCNNASITKTNIVTETRWMTIEKYNELADVDEDDNEDNEE